MKTFGKHKAGSLTSIVKEDYILDDTFLGGIVVVVRHSLDVSEWPD